MQQQLYALILADRAAEILARALNRDPDASQAVVDVIPISGCACGGPALSDMTAAIEFQGTLADEGPVSGLILGGLAGPRALNALASSCGLKPEDCREGDLLAEYLNIVTGLAAADWSGRGLDISFSPPLAEGIDFQGASDTVCRIAAGGQPEESLTVMLLFNSPQNR